MRKHRASPLTTICLELGCKTQCIISSLANAIEQSTVKRSQTRAVPRLMMLRRDCGCKWNCSIQTQDDAEACCGGGAFRDCGVFLPIAGFLSASNFKAN